MAGVYAPRAPATGVLYGVVRAHLTTFLAEVDAHTDGLPPWPIFQGRGRSSSVTFPACRDYSPSPLATHLGSSAA